MKLRVVVLSFMFGAVGLAVVNCGSDDDTADPKPLIEAGPTSSSGFNPGDTGPPIDSGSSGVGGKCEKLTCEKIGASCGPAGDGCGGVIECGTCDGGTCGGGGTPSVCGGPAPCQPKTCDDLDIGCGPAGDGCGGRLDCGSCAIPNLCGLGGPSKCGGGFVDDGGVAHLPDGGVCNPRSVCAPGECGPVPNGCGGLLTCGGCTGTDTCGALKPSFCGTPPCTKTTCAAQGADCGFVADGCGGIINCGGPNACDAKKQFCGLGGPNKCGDGGNAVDAGTCVNFCADQVKNNTCAPNAKTTITGTVYAPNGKLPVPDAFVYIPNGSKTAPFGVAPFVDGTATGTCEQCTLGSLGTPLVSTKTNADGTFTLRDVPPEVDFPLVIQLGRWRRMVMIANRTKCSTTAISTDLTRFPTKQNEGSNRDSIPLFAVSTGSVDGLECVLLKMGVDPTEFTNPAGLPGGTGRVRLYRDNKIGDAEGGSKINDQTPFTDQALTDTDAHLSQYDAVIFGCPGAPNNRPAATDARIRAYADRGGRVFATHFNHVYLSDNPPWNTTVKWDTVNERKFDKTFGLINTSFPKGQLLSDWMAVPLNPGTQVGVGARNPALSPARLELTEARNNADLPTAAGAQYWMTRFEDTPGNGAAVLHYTFNTPVNQPPANQCGRVLFSDFHVTTGNQAGVQFPLNCQGSDFTPQEKTLAFFLFDLTACITPDNPQPNPFCKKKTCAEQGVQCGLAGDGCGGQLNCNACPSGQVCSGTPAKCSTPICTPTTCQAQGAECGAISNGCGGKINSCGTCPPGQICGGAGPNKCGVNTCPAQTCQEQNIQCGPAGNTCGGELDCGPCPANQTCGGGGTPNVCGAPACTKRTCEQANAECGPIADGCGALVECGTCPNGTFCGFGGPNRCGARPVQ